MLLRLSLALLCSMPMLSYACSCADRPADLVAAVQEGIVASSAVVEAEVIALKTEKNWQKITWKVSRNWKGPHAANSYIETRTQIGCCACGKTVEQVPRYLLYLHGGQPYFITTCSMSASFPTAAVQVRVLEDLYKPEFAKPDK
ncbi:hypothetical protein [Parachitinimonas caeni]|uniref:Uncharacterized protein n=1 Tax=Parachitinimonas caeni TaxID=3031301 RepID=A0ABT7DUJ1_9NEIS|nr:hypothetical protein [Parachitinimonas caeni]MDK2123735.1 hypothetical protein [Parachitinimonas caeni]